MVKEVNLGVSVMARKERGVDLGDSLSVITDTVWQTAETLHNLGDPGLSDVAKKTIKDKFAAVGLPDYMALSKGHKAGSLTVQQEDLWIEIIDAMAVCVYMGHGNDEDFFSAVDTAKETGEFTNLMSKYFGTPALAGTERLIADYVPASEGLREIMGLISTLMKTGGLTEAILSDYIGDVSRTKVDRHDKGAKQMIVGYLGEMVAGMSGGTRSARTAQDEYYEAQTELMENMRTVSLDELVNAYFYVRAPRERSPQNWEYKVPEWLPNTSQEEWRKLLSYQDQWLGAIYRKRGDGRYNNDLKYLGEEVMNMQQLVEGLLQPWFNHPDFQVRGVMNQIMHDLMVPHEVKGVVDGKNVTRRVYLFETGPNPKDPNRQVYTSQLVRDFVVDEGKYKDGLVGRLIGKDGILEGKDPRAAKMAVALAMDMMEMGGVFTTADSLRRLAWESDAVRIAQRPETKLRAKGMGGEVWGGPWLEYCLQGTDDTAEAYKRAQAMGIVPVLLSGSFMDLPYKIKEDETSFAERIWGNEDFDVGRGDADLYFSWRKDHLKPAIDIWSHISGRAPLELKQYREFDNVVTQWGTGLRNAYDQLQKNGDSLCTMEMMCAAIGGSTGLWPFEGPYLRVSGSRGDEKSQSAFEVMFEVGYEMITGLGLSKEESSRVMSFFGLDRRHRIHFGDQIVDYKLVHNPRVSETVRRNGLKKMWTRKRK